MATAEGEIKSYRSLRMFVSSTISGLVAFIAIQEYSNKVTIVTSLTLSQAIAQIQTKETAYGRSFSMQLILRPSN